MCSIIGYYQLGSTGKPDANFINYGFDLMRHRGPDAEKYICSNRNKVALGNQRLAIIDLNEKANQPMESKESIIVFNGEIYNFHELKTTFLQNYVFKTNSDTEVLQMGIDIYGLKFLHNLNGMFAFAYYSKKNKEVILVRDRFGVKPLYYLIQDDVLYFSSEMKPLIKINKNTRANLRVYKNFIFDSAADYDEETFIKNIFQIPKGHILRSSGSKVKAQKWYFGDDHKFDQSIFENKLNSIDYAEDLLTDAIKKRLISDVPISITLSGGLDSSLIYTLIKEKLYKDIKVFTIFDKGIDISEENRIKNLAKAYGEKVDPIYVDLQKSIIDKIKESLYYLEFPIWDPSAVVYLDIYKKIAEEGFKIVIEGHGSDEQLGGYPYMFMRAAEDYLHVGKILTCFNIIRNYENNINNGGIRTINMFKYVIRTLKNSWHNRQITFQACMNDAFNYKILPIVLRTFDRLTMRSSVESRSPYMDYRIVEFFKKMPLEFKISSLGSKAILREILKKYKKFEIAENKQKIGFGANIINVLKNADTRIFLTDLISNFSMKEFEPYKKNTLYKIMNDDCLSESDVVDIWKVASLSYINDLFGLK